MFGGLGAAPPIRFLNRTWQETEEPLVFRPEVGRGTTGDAKPHPSPLSYGVQRYPKYRRLVVLILN